MSAVVGKLGDYVLLQDDRGATALAKPYTHRVACRIKPQESLDRSLGHRSHLLHSITRSRRPYLNILFGLEFERLGPVRIWV